MRTVLLSVACLALGFLLGMWADERPLDAPGEAVSFPRRSVAPPAPADPLLMGREAPAVAVPPAAPVTSASAETTEEAEAGEPRVVARIAVTVPLPAGAKRISGTVYALPAGRPGVRRVRLIPHADLDGETAVVPLPAAGRWDVGYAGLCGEALVENVHVEAGSLVPVRLVLPPQGAITFRFADREAGDWARGREARVRVKPIRSANASAYPGRDEGRNWQRRQSLDPDGPVAISPLPTDREYEVAVQYKSNAKEEEQHGISLRRPYPKWKLRAPRTRVRTGAEVVIALVEQAELRVAFALRDTASLEWSKNASQSISARLLRDDQVLDRLRVKVWGASELRSRRTLMHADPGPATLVWEGGCCLPGRVEGIELVAGEQRRVEAPIDLDPSFRPVESPKAASGGFRVRLEGELSRQAEAQVVVYAADPRRGSGILQTGEEIPSAWPGSDKDVRAFDVRGRMWDDVHTVTAVHGPDRAARAVPVDPGADEVVLHLEPAGHLVVVPTWWTSAQMGEVFLQSTDGRPVPVCVWLDGGGAPDGLEPAFAIPAGAGMLIGPLVPGTYSFDVLRGATRVGRVTGTVRARRIEVLRLPR